ncbi:MAG: hypothetical protein OMM_01492 [Candidatus Magnetoglobus multicellularis str. Araruama]|uniref:Uncharacterized protein n=1 Tax=Candidatus Magnetoglobus multicellularis str. Araruama TaxID=890399 RepID=A0A1V1PD60_9BACT|nr:MAG: hypothetical protein OMM_01492 [Candidatus Magnetoglobus multicellularis str. Araruama]
MAQQKLKEEAEKAKIAFAANSQKEQIHITSFLKDGENHTHDLDMWIKRDVFIQHIKSLLDLAKACISDTLKEAHLSLDDINRIILVGGSTKADWVVDSIKSLYPTGEEKMPYRAKNVDLIVSQGAAVYGASTPIELIGQRPEEDQKDAIIESIVSHHLGIELEMGEFGNIIEKGLPLDDKYSVQKVTRIFGNQANMDTMQIIIWKTQKSIDFIDLNGVRKSREKFMSLKKIVRAIQFLNALANLY